MTTFNAYGVNWHEEGPKLLAALQAAEKAMAAMSTYFPPNGPARTQARDAIARVERAGDLDGRRQWWHARFGKNWVLARRTSRIVDRYGDDVRCISKREYAKAEEDYLNGVAP